MSPRIAWLAVALVLLGGGRQGCAAEEPDVPLEEFLAKWEAASRRCQSLDAALTVMRYDPVFNGDKPEVSKGRFYYESPGIGRFEIEGAESIIWQKGRSLWLDATEQACITMTKEILQSWIRASDGSWWSWLSDLHHLFMHPQHLLPLAVEIDAASLQDRYDLKLGQRDEGHLVIATPREDNTDSMYAEVAAIVDRETFLTKAVQVRYHDGQCKTVYLLEEMKVNAAPEDRDELIEPDLSGFKLVEYN